MHNKQFSERLNDELDEIGVPQPIDERIDALAKLIQAPRYKAEALLNGNANPNDVILQTLARELEVSIDWLLGKDHARREH